MVRLTVIIPTIHIYEIIWNAHLPKNACVHAYNCNINVIFIKCNQDLFAAS